MKTPVAIECAWNGEAFVPINSWWAKCANQHYAKGEVLRLIDDPEPSSNSRRHYFAVVHRGWESLPEKLVSEYPSPDILRAKLLIKTGFCTERSIVCASKAEAQRMASFIAAGDPYAVVVPRVAMVSVYTAESQSAKAMGRERFQRSKEAVLAALADLLGVTSKELAAPTAAEYMGAG